MSLDTYNSTGMAYQCCPICGNNLDFSLEIGVARACSCCGYKILYSDDMPRYNQSIPDTNSLVNEPDNKPMLFGWVCPKCGAVLSPWTDCCPNCTQKKWEFTCGTGGSNL